MKLEFTPVLKDSNGNVVATLPVVDFPYTPNVNMDAEIEIVHDPASSNGHPLPRPKTAPKF